MTLSNPYQKYINTPRTCLRGCRPTPNIFFGEEKVRFAHLFFSDQNVFYSESRQLACEKNILGGEEKVSGVGWSNSVNNEKIMKTRFLRFFGPPCIFWEFVASMSIYASQLCRAYFSEDFKWSAISVTWLGQMLCDFKWSMFIYCILM